MRAKKYNCEICSDDKKHTKDIKMLQEVVNKYRYYKMNLVMQLDKYISHIIRNNEIDVGYSGVVNAHR